MRFEDIDILELLPQRPPFIMVGRLMHYDDTLTVTSTEIKPDNIFVDADSLFSESGIVENIAQTCASRIGYINKYILMKGIQIGFIGAVRNLRIHSLPAVGQTIITSIEKVEEVFGMTLVNAVVKCDDRIIADGSMKIAVNESE